ncbi:MAG: hypothetical protein NC310_02535 [Roseburia sp.]|nr:hypothetical protein [Anaeroplasma bactoclasticum]MCM1195934.1 hypothetical protein [Roseburia sp.]MCM1556578.1 hypothetical protein [Anaeroplasma bactoclasticum]
MKKNRKKDISEKTNMADKISKIPSWLIILLLKYWAAAAAIFFSVISCDGLNLGENKEVTGEQVFAIDIAIIILIGLFLALFSNYIVRPSVRMMYNRKNKVYRYNMINFKGFISFPIALAYNFLLSFILYFIVYFLGIHGLILNPFGMTNYGIEPFSYALFYIIVDFIFLFIKDTILDIKERVKYKRESRGVEEDV